MSVLYLPGKMSDTLLQASVQVIDHTRCNAEDAYQGEVTEKMLCAGVPGGGVDTCQVGPPRIMCSSVDGWGVLERCETPEAALSAIRGGRETRREGRKHSQRFKNGWVDEWTDRPDKQQAFKCPSHIQR